MKNFPFRNRFCFESLLFAFSLLITGQIVLALAPGDLDQTFGTNGRVTTEPELMNGCNATLVQPDGKILVTGYTVIVEPAGGGSAVYVLVRYNANGTLDSSFGTGGMVISHIYGSANAIALQPDGKILIGGYNWISGSNYDFGIARFNADGSFDGSFGTTGIVIVDINPDDEIRSIVVQADGKIILFGRTVASGQTQDIAAIRLDRSGSLDPSFGTNGRVIIDTPGVTSVANSVVVQPDGKILFGGGNGSPVVGRLNQDGSFDNTFGVNGRVQSAVPPATQIRSLMLRSDGKIVAAAGASEGINVLIRYNSDGTLDTTFGNGGTAATTGSPGYGSYAASIQPNGKVVLTGNAETFFGALRFDANGSLDQSFGTNGRVMTISQQFYGMGYRATAIQPDGGIIAAGFAKIHPIYDALVVSRYVGDPIVSVSGRVLTPDGRGLRNATVTYTDAVGTHNATTSSFGYYSFDNVMTSQSVTVRVSSRSYRYSSRNVQVNDTLADIDFTGLE